MVEPNQTANSIIQQALQQAGVAPRNINLPADTGTELAFPNPYAPEGAPKGQVKGELPAGEETSEAELAEPSEPKSAEPKAGQPLGKAEIEAAINQASSRFQSIMDRKLNQMQAQLTGTVDALNQFFENQENTSLTGLPAEEQVLRRLERLEKGTGQPKIQVQQPIEQQPVQFYQQLANFVDAVGMKIDDKRIDWAPNVSDPQTGFNRFLGSIKKALVEDQTKVIQELKKNGEKEIQNVRKKAGVDKVSQSGPGGAGLPDLSKMTPMQKIEYGFKLSEEAAQINQ